MPKPTIPDDPRRSDPPPEPTQDVRIAKELIADIIGWRLKPGEWIREREVAERFAVSHGPVREAFRRLERDGFVEVVPWRGARIIPLDAKRARDVVELWKLLFANVCGLAAQRITPEDGETLMQLIAGYEATVRATSDPVEHFRSSNFVGQYITDRCGNDMAAQALMRITSHTRWQYGLLRGRKFAGLQPAAGIRSAELFRRVAEAIVARDSLRAEQSARELMALSEGLFAEAVADHIARMPKAAAPARRRPSTAGRNAKQTGVRRKRKAKTT